MGVGGGVAVKHGGVVGKGFFQHVGAQAHAPYPVILHQIGGGLVNGKAVLGGGVLCVADGEDAVIDGGGQEGNGAHAQHQHHRNQLPVHQSDEHAGRQRQTDPAGAGIGLADGHDAGGQHHQAGQPPLPAFGAEQQAHIQGDEHDQQLREVVGVVKQGVDPSGHSLVQRHILEGGHDFHAHIALIAAVNSGHGDARHGQTDGQAELVQTLHGIDRHQRQQERGGVEQEEADGKGRGQAAHQREEDAQQVEQHVWAEHIHIQTALGFRGAAQDEQRRHRHGAQEAVGVVPKAVGGRQHGKHKEAQEEKRGAAPGGQPPENEAAVP